MPDICIQVGRRIRVLRKKRGYTQENLASRAEIARESLSRIELGKREAGLYILQRLAKALDVNVRDLFEGI